MRPSRLISGNLSAVVSTDVTVWQITMEDALHFRVFVDPLPGAGAAAHAALLDDAAQVLLLHVMPQVDGHLWHRDAFSLSAREGSRETGDEAHLAGELRFGECVDDEWFAVWLLLELSAAFPTLAITAEDAVDGQILLIEAAHCLPRWADDPETSANRALIRAGAIHLVGPALAPPTPEGGARLVDALAAVRAGRVPPHGPVTAAVRARLRGYPDEAVRLSTHRKRLVLPLPAALALASAPWLVSRAVEALCARDALSMRAAAKMSRLAPGAHPPVLATVRFSRCLYAQLLAQRFTPPRSAGFELPAPSHAAHARASLSAKLVAGLEMALADEEMAAGKQRGEEGREGAQWREAAPAAADREGDEGVHDARGTTAQAATLAAESAAAAVRRCLPLLLRRGVATSAAAATAATGADAAAADAEAEAALQTKLLAQAALVQGSGSKQEGAAAQPALPQPRPSSSVRAVFDSCARPSADQVATAEVQAQALLRRREGGTASWAELVLASAGLAHTAADQRGASADRNGAAGAAGASAGGGGGDGRAVRAGGAAWQDGGESDSDGWLALDEGELEEMMRERAGAGAAGAGGAGSTAAGENGGKTAAGADPVARMMRGLGEFMAGSAALEGVEPSAHRQPRAQPQQRLAAAAAGAAAAGNADAAGADAGSASADAEARAQVPTPAAARGGGAGERPVGQAGSAAAEDPLAPVVLDTAKLSQLLHSLRQPSATALGVAGEAAAGAGGGAAGQARPWAGHAGGVRAGSASETGSPPGEAAAEEDEEDDDDDDDEGGSSGSSAGSGEEGEEEGPEAEQLLAELMAAMDAQLKEHPAQHRGAHAPGFPEPSAMGRAPPSQKPDSEIELEVAAHMLAALEAEGGMPGPASSLLASMGVVLPPPEQPAHGGDEDEGDAGRRGDLARHAQHEGALPRGPARTGGTDPLSLDE